MNKLNVVLGAGAAGLAAAWELVEKGRSVHVLERRSLVGGLLSYIEKNGNIYEYGTHVFHTDNEVLRARVKKLMGDKLFEFDRAGKLHIKFRNKYYSYPLNGIDVLMNLPLHVSVQCVLSFISSTICWKLSNQEPAHSADVLQKHFGKKLYEIFFKDYTRKFWGIPCEELDKTFALERIPRSDVFKVIHDVFEKLGIGKMFSDHNLTERAIGKLYYAKTGIHELTDTIATYVTEKHGEITTEVELKKIHIEKDNATRIEYAVDGKTEILEADKIISTIPLRSLINLISPPPEEIVLEAAARLSYLPLTVCGLLVKKKPVRNAICTYFRNSIFNRLSEPTIHGLETIPSDRSILLAEMSAYSISIANVENDDKIIQKVLEDAAKEKLFKEDDVEDCCVFRYQEGYPIYHLGFKNDLKTIEQYLNRLSNVYSTGRQGAFRYVNTHATMQMGIDTANRIVRNSKDKNLFFIQDIKTADSKSKIKQNILSQV